MHRNCCLIFSTADWDAPYWTNKQHTAISFKKNGWEVYYIESLGLRSPSISSSRDWKRIINRLKKGIYSLCFGSEKNKDGVYIVSPLTIPIYHKLKIVKIFNSYIINIFLKKSLNNKKYSQTIIWTYHPYIIRNLKYLDYQKLIYHCVDELSAIPKINGDDFRLEEAKIINLANHTFVTSKNLYNRLIRINSNIGYYSNCVDLEHFNNKLIVPLQNFKVNKTAVFKVVYHGVLSEIKINFRLLYSIVSFLPDVQFYLIGEEPEGQNNDIFNDIKQFPNVFFVGYVPYKILPSYLREMDVGILPTNINDYTSGMFPMKYYEYIASGLPVVSTKIQSLCHLSNDCLILSNESEFKDSIIKQFKRGRLKNSEIINEIGSNTWDERFSLMCTAARINAGYQN